MCSACSSAPIRSTSSGTTARAIPVRQVRAGDTLIADMRTVEAVQTDVPFHSLQFLLPRLFLRELAEDLEASEVGDLRTPAGRQHAMAERAGATVAETPREPCDLRLQPGGGRRAGRRGGRGGQPVVKFSRLVPTLNSRFRP